MKKVLKQHIFTIAVLSLLGLIIHPSISQAQKSLKGIYFSHASGFYDSPFDLTLSIENVAATMYYTIDGSNPKTSETRINGGNSDNLPIDPTIATIRPTTPAFLVRAIAMIGDSAVTEHVSATYIFLEHVKKQAYPGGDWPFSNVNGQFIDLDVDKDVIEDPLYADQIDEALLDIPSISIVTDNENLFGRSEGIYVNAHGHGPKWERPCSIELINPDGSAGFYENAGLRIRGGWSRHPEFAKHAFRVFFREEYGTDKLRFPLFEDEGVDEFDKIDLRCAQNYAWSNGNGEHNTFVREVFARDAQGEMGQPYTRSRYYHLYLNGMYWGLFQTQERSEARFAASYFGGDKEDYDVVKVNTDQYQYELEATDGVLNTWSMIYEMSRSSFQYNASYFQLEGKNSIGKPIPGKEVLVNIENLIDYMIIVFYIGSFDAPVTQFRGNDYPNNFYTINSREDKSQGFSFFVHDMEHGMMIDPVNVGIGINENRVNIGSISGDRQMQISEFKYFNPQWLHHRLSVNKEYQMRFADRAARHLSNNGVFTQQRATELFNKRVEQIEMAIIGESARWGDTKKSNAFTKDNAWIPELDEVRNVFFAKRTNIVIGQLRNAGLYKNIKAPEYLSDDSIFDVSEYELEGNISIEIQNPNSSGEIHYTLNGQDPRLVGGYINPSAQSINSGKSMDFNGSAIINSRVKIDDEWSALRTLSLISQNDDLSNLKVTEIHYHPEAYIVDNDTLIGGKDLEFIEFKNVGSSALNLSGVKIDSAVSYTFPNNAILPPGEFYVVASKPSKFYEYYGLQASGNYKNNLANSGEQVVVIDKNGNLLIDFTYDDTTPWFDKADGDGPSLASVEFNPTGDPADHSYWRLSIYDGGTPFRDDKLITALTENDGLQNSSIKIFPNPTIDAVNISVSSLNNEANLEIKLYDLNGQLLMEGNIKNHEKMMLSNHKISAGIKLLTIQHQGIMETAKLMVAE